MGTTETVTTPGNGGVIQTETTTVTPQPHSDSDVSGGTIPAPGGPSAPAPATAPLESGDSVVPSRGTQTKNGVDG